MKINTKYDIGEIVYLKTDEDQKDFMVIQMTVSISGVQYNLRQGTYDSWHFEFEISEERNLFKPLGL